MGNNLTNFAPRLGAAWSPTPKWTVRAGAGIFYVQDQGYTFFDEALDTAGKSLYFANDYPLGTLSFENPFNAKGSNQWHPSTVGLRFEPRFAGQQYVAAYTLYRNL